MIKRLALLALAAVGLGGPVAVAAAGLTSSPTAPSTPASSLVEVVEYYHAALDHYFITADANEIELLDNGTMRGWIRTGQAFTAYATNVVDSLPKPVCRFYGRPEAKLDSHFYSGSADECGAVMQRFSASWVHESSNVFRVNMPDPATGACIAGTRPVYRLFNSRVDANHRYTADLAVRNVMQTAGFVPEGYGELGVALCAVVNAQSPSSPPAVAASGTPVPPALAISATQASPDTFSFSATAIPVGGASVASYRWAFGDGESATGASVSHRFAKIGSYAVFLTVTDSRGAVATTAMSVTVSTVTPPPPTPSAPPPPAPPPTVSFVAARAAPDTYSFTASASAASGATIASYRWVFGDGTTGTGTTASHRYSATGTYAVVLTVTDSKGKVGTASRAVTATISTPTSPPPPVPPAPPPPAAPVVAIVSTPSTSDTFNFSSTVTTAPGVTASSYQWTFGDNASASGATTSHRYAASGNYTVKLTVTDSSGKTGTASTNVSANVITVPPPVAGAPKRVLIGEVAGDGPTWARVNFILETPWRVPGGDWRDRNNVANGPAPFSSRHIAASDGRGYYDIDVTALTAKLRADNTAYFIRATGATPAKFATLQSIPPLNQPAKLTVVTDRGTFTPPLLSDVWMSPTTNGSLNRTDYMSAPAMVKFDLSNVVGTVQRATLSLFMITNYGAFDLMVDYADLPVLLTSPGEQAPGSVEHGIASTVSRDTDLAQHPDVLVYVNMKDAATVNNSFQWGSGGATEFVQWPEYGLGASRVMNGPAIPGVSGNTAINRRNLWIDRPIGIYNKLPWRMPIGQAPEHLFLRYMLKLENDVAVMMPNGQFSNWQGTKLPGLSGTKEQYTDAANWPSSYRATYAFDEWQLRPEHGVPSLTNGRAMSYMMYSYDPDNPFSTPNRGRMESTGFFAMTPGRTYSIEIGVKLNTFTNGVPNHDGVLTMWLDGVRAFHDTRRIYRNYVDNQILSAEMLIMHGGMGMPQANQHYQISGWTVSKSYIGPPKRLQ